MIDVSKIKAGDEVTVRGRVERTDAGIDRPIYVSFGKRALTVDNADIVSYTPAPREFKPGDKVHLTRSSVIPACNWIVEHICGETAWIRRDDFSANRLEHTRDLIHAEPCHD